MKTEIKWRYIWRPTWRLRVLWDRVLEWLAGRIPRRIAYFVLIRGWAKATSGEWSDQDLISLTVEEMVKRWKS